MFSEDEKNLGKWNTATRNAGLTGGRNSWDIVHRGRDEPEYLVTRRPTAAEESVGTL